MEERLGLGQEKMLLGWCGLKSLGWLLCHKFTLGKIEL
jgi:hypothetical protein